jgi:hypothetical protein
LNSFIPNYSIYKGFKNMGHDFSLFLALLFCLVCLDLVALTLLSLHYYLWLHSQKYSLYLFLSWKETRCMCFTHESICFKPLQTYIRPWFKRAPITVLAVILNYYIVYFNEIWNDDSLRLLPFSSLASFCYILLSLTYIL